MIKLRCLKPPVINVKEHIAQYKKDSIFTIAEMTPFWEGMISQGAVELLTETVATVVEKDVDIPVVEPFVEDDEDVDETPVEYENLKDEDDESAPHDEPQVGKRYKLLTKHGKFRRNLRVLTVSDLVVIGEDDNGKRFIIRHDKWFAEPLEE